VTSLAELQAGDPQRVGPYVLLGRIGSGGMGRVYLARSPGGRQVAVKVIRAQLAEDAAFRARFTREVAAARKVGGLFTAQVVDADLDGPVPWLVTAYVPGTSLADAVDQQGPLPPATVLALAAGLAEGLNAIHAAGVIHRDLKPSNVLLAPDGPRIIDFGISSAAEATALTGTGLTIGSPGFMSPEQAQGLVVGPASDIFSLAGVLIFAARGEGPFGIGDTAALLYRVVHGTPNIDQIPAGIQTLIDRCLSRDPAQRPTAARFLAELTAAYPSAADLTDWLPVPLLELSARRVAEAGSHPPPTAADRAGAAVEPGPGLARAGSAPAAEPAAGGTGPPEPTQTSQGFQGYQEPGRYPGAQGGQDTPWWARQQDAAEQQTAPPLPYQGEAYQGQAYQGQAYQGQAPSPGQPGAPGGQWYTPPVSRRRRRWPWVVGIAALCVAVVAGLGVALGSGHHGAPAAGPSPTRSAKPTPNPTPTVGDLLLSQLRVGDCLTGADLDLNTDNPWPKLSMAVPCSQKHTAEVFFADNHFWPKSSAYPGNATISKDGDATCDSAFRAYVGIAYSKSMYTWTNIIPDASTWPTGDRGLHCVAYDATTKEPSGAYVTGSIRGSRR
jgi:Protein kinase domain/Septum formation